MGILHQLDEILVKQRIPRMTLRTLWLGCLACLAALWLSFAPNLAHSTPVAINLARPAWNSSDLQVEIVRRLLEELGYKVNASQVFSPEEFYAALNRGDTDLWLDTWLPDHDPYIDRATAAGLVLATTSPITEITIQGYRVDLATAIELDITSIADLQDPEIAARFDLDGNGKADLIGCNQGWACAEMIDRHLEAYDLNETVEQVSDSYDYLVRQTIERYDRGEPVLFFTWTPQGINRILPAGEKTRWLTVPEAVPMNDEIGQALPEPIADLEGCADNPCLTGFPTTEVRPGFRQALIEQHPAIVRLLDRVRIPTEAIETQLSQRMSGEDMPEAMRRYADEWLADNRETVDTWLAEANEEATGDPETADLEAIDAPLRVVTKTFSPFVNDEDGSYSGFSIELWEEIARSLGVKYRINKVDTVDKLLENVRAGEADLGIAGVSMTAEREEIVDFSHPFFDSGLQIMVRDLPNNPIEALLSGLVQILTTPELYYGIVVFVLTLGVAANAIWLIEHQHNEDFPKEYFKGIWDAFWWSAVTVTTVGYGDKTPRTAIGKLFALVWMCAGYFVFAYFIATVTTSFTVDRLAGTIANPGDLRGKQVGTIDASTAEQYLIAHDINATSFQSTDDLYQNLHLGKLDAVVYDAPVLQHYALHTGAGEVELVGSVFERQNYGIVLPQDSPYREQVNEALLKLRESGIYDELYARWFGADNT